jgi:hypothetical protein
MPFFKSALRTVLPAALLSLAAVPEVSAATLFSPLCQTNSGGVLFFAESIRHCPNAEAACRERFWSYAALQPSMATNHAWKFSPIGTSRLDESASPASNAKSAQQIFDAPKDAQCAAFFRSDKLPSPDLADAEGWFRYSFEKGQLMVHWKTLKAVVQFETRWNVDFCDKGCGAAGQGPRAVEATKAQMTDFPELSPAFDLRLNNVAILGFPVPTIKNVASTGNIISVRIPALKKAQADLLYRDALSFSKSARDDLLGGAMITGLLDAALQLDPQNEGIRLDYARHLASQAAASQAVRELRELPATADLKKKLTEDKAFDSIRSAAAFKAFMDSLK